MRMETVLSMASDFPFSYKAALLSAIETIDLEKVGQAIETLRRAREEGRRIFVCGNGGSASTRQPRPRRPVVTPCGSATWTGAARP